MSEHLEHLGYGVTAIDTGFQRPLFDASHLLVESGQAAFVDVGTAFAVPRLLEALATLGLAPEAVSHVILTHVHLDHAGGAGELIRSLPRARLVVHPRGARHMVDPARLWAGATAVYGEAEMRRSYGGVTPVEASRVVEAPEGFRVDLAGRSLLVLDTPGHARHHLCLWDEASRGVFTGDSFGLSYRELASERGPLILPTTTPVQFEPEALQQSIERLVALKPRVAYLTHYSQVADPPALAPQLRRRIDELVALGHAADGRADRATRLRAGMRELFLRWTHEHGTPLDAAAVLELLRVDTELNAQGLESWLDRGRR